MNIKNWFIYSSIIFTSSYGNSAALDMSGQSVAAFLQEGNYAEATLLVLDTDIKGKVVETQNQQVLYEYSNNIKGNFLNYNFAIKVDLDPKWSFGIIYDKPFGVDAVYVDTQKYTPNHYEIDIDTQELSLLLGYKPTENSKIYAGPVYQTAQSNFDFSGGIYGLPMNYSANLKEDSSFGWLAGVMYKNPDIAFQTDLTYRSSVSHHLDTKEAFDFPIFSSVPWQVNGRTSFKMPQSVNFNLQTGFFYKTLFLFNVRWVDWTQFKIKPELYKSTLENVHALVPSANVDNNLYTFKKDQWSSMIGLAKQFNPKWSGMIYTGIDYGGTIADENTAKYNHFMGLAAQYNPAKNYFIGGSVAYINYKDSNKIDVDLLDSTIHTSTDYHGNYAMAYLLRMGYRF